MKKLLTYLLSALMVLGLLAPALAQAQDASGFVQTSGTPAQQVQQVISASNAAEAQANTGITSGALQSQSGTAGTQLAPNTTNISNGAGQDDLGCSGSSIASGMGIAICTSHLVYYVFVGLGSWFANIAAYVFDYAVYISLSSAAYALDFIAVGWSVVRDVANMAFLFILLYIGFKTLLNAETAGTIRLLVGVIVVALLVNFSFVMTRIVIDAGNIVAVQFYNAIAAGSQGTVPSSAVPGSGAVGVPVRDITATIMNALNPQALIGSTGTASTFKNFVSDTSNSPMYYLIVSSVVFILTGLTLFMLAATFIYVAVKFILRVVGLWFVIIAAPVAFVAAIFRGKEGGNVWFKKWLGYLINFSFYPAIFLFMFYIQIRFMLELNNAQLFNNLLQATSGAGQSWTAIVQAAANVGVRLGFIMATMYMSLSVADMMVKQGSSIAGWVQGKVLGGLSGGVITGPARWLSQNRFAQRVPGLATAAAMATRADLRNVPGLGLGLRGVTAASKALNKSAGTMPVDYSEFRNPALTNPNRHQASQGQAQGQQAQAQQGQQTQAAGQQAQTAIPQPGARRIPLPAGAAREGQQAQGQPGLRRPMTGDEAHDNLTSQSFIVPTSLAAQRAIQSINKQDVHAAPTITLTTQIPNNPSGTSTVDITELKNQVGSVREAIASLKNGAGPTNITHNYQVTGAATQQTLKPTSVHMDISEESISRLAKKLGPKLAASLPHDRGPGGSGPAPAAPAQARPEPQTSTDVLGSEGMKA